MTDDGGTTEEPAEVPAEEPEPAPARDTRGPIIALVVALLALAAVIAFWVFRDPGATPTSTTGTTLPGASTTVPDTSPTSTPATSPTTAPATTPTTTVTTTTPEATTTTEAPAEVSLVPVFFLHDSGGRADRPGPFLAPGARNADTLEEAIEALLGGLTPSENDLEMSTSLPGGVALNGVTVDGSVATVDLSSTFEEGGGTLAMTARLAQLVFTVTGFDPEITGVRLFLDGSPVEEFSSEGIILDDPMNRDSVQDLLPGILVESPQFDGWSGAPVTVTGIAAAFEGVFQMEILDADGNLVADLPFVQTDSGIGWGSFSVTFDEDALPPMPADLQIRVYELSAEDGSVVSERFQPFGYREQP